jgi:probable HAF family extracellular repeat protein
VVVGAYNSGSQLHAYILSAGVYTTIDPPGAVSAEAEGINSSGEVVGTYLDGSNKTHGFTYVSGVFTNVDVPGALITTTTGIDDQGEIVGSYQVASGAYIGYGGKSQ